MMEFKSFNNYLITNFLSFNDIYDTIHYLFYKFLFFSHLISVFLGPALKGRRITCSVVRCPQCIYLVNPSPHSKYQPFTTWDQVIR